MQSIDLATFKWQDLIRVDYTDNIPRDNPILESRRKRLDELSRLEEREYQKYLQPQEHPATRNLRWIHYTYGAYELIRHLLN